MSSRWSESETCIFAKLYLSHECMWNTEHNQYKSRVHRQEALRTIISRFGAITNIIFDETEARRKIKNLRSTYSQELSKIRERSTPTSPYQSSLKWFADWHKCYGQKLKDERSSCDETMDAEDSSQKIWVPESSETLNEDTTKDPFESNADHDYILLLKTEPDQEGKVDTQDHKSFKPKKRKIKRNSSLTIDKIVENYASKNSDITVDSTSKEDEFDIYGKYIASQLRGMGLPRALRVQLQIQSIVSEARIEHLSNDQD